MSAAIVVRRATVVTMDSARRVLTADVFVDREGRITAVAEGGSTALLAEREIDARGRILVPGLVQAHLHLCQTLFRGLCEDRPLLRWLRERTWPLEAAHDEATLRASAHLGIAELLLGGTTSVLDMGTVHYTDTLFEAAGHTGIRYTGGKAMMDRGADVRGALLEDTVQSLRESDRLAERWHGTVSGRLRYAYSPRFALTCSMDLMRAVGVRARANDLLVHTHASEQRQEAELVRETFGSTNIQLLADLGLGDANACLAHAVWPEKHEIDVLASHGATVVHCPSCNMKLGSGIAPVPGYLDRGVNVALGADGAASNNRLDIWEEMRLAGLLAKLRNGAEALSARGTFEMATVNGALALGLEDEIGSVEVGKRADLVILDLEQPHAVGPDDVYTRLVYSARASDVRTVLVDGKLLVEEGRLCSLNETEVLEEAARQRRRLIARAGLGEAVRH